MIASVAVGCRGKLADNEAHAQPASEPRTVQPASRLAPLRRLTDDELTKSLIGRAERILDEYGDEPIGTQIPFTHRGRRYVARIETHYHPVGGPERPWGHHRGVTLFAADSRAPR